MSLVSEFKDFVLRGNVVDLAVGVAIGAGFSKVVNAIVADIITPLVGIPGKLDFNGKYASVHFHGATFLIGDVISNTITFLMLALIIFLFVVKPVNFLMAHSKSQEPEADTTRECPECLSKIPVAAKRCAFCTTEVA